MEHIVEQFGREMVRKPDITAEQQILLSLWMLANKDSYREASDRFNVSLSTAWDLFMQFCFTCTSMAHLIIKWPENLLMTKQAFSNAAGFPGVVGCIDGTHIPILMPQENGHRYINRKGVPSVILLATCDNKLKFTWINVGWPGSVHDSRVYRNELLPILEEDGEEMLGRDGHILGDAAFPLSKWIQTPFRDNGHLNEEERRYNNKHSSTRMAVERSFGRLKSKFRRLQKLEMLRVDLMPNVITTACILHNMSVDEDFSEDEAEVEEDEAQEPRERVNMAEAADGEIKRMAIMQHLAEAV